ncbi:MAG TPA: ice-binding family protein, partial [Aggregatilineales bacterium]|nr:ice-binding family protein [Aggregatilineales bacterium]
MLTKSVLSRLTLRFVLVGSVIATLLAMGVMPVQAATAPNMGALGPCAVLAGQHIFSAGTSVVTGNLCLSPGPLTQITFPTPPNVLNGTRHAADGPALAAQASWISANGFLSAQPGATPKGKLGTGTSASIAPGIYDITGIGGAVTLQGAGVYIFRGSNLLFDAGTNMILAGGASACNVFWQDASSTTVNSTANIVGNIFAVTSIVLKSGANLRGRALAQNADVT